MSEPKGGAKLFDVRLLIAGILGVYGIILTIMGIGSSAASLHKADGIRINLWVGIAMIVVGALFFWWSRARPLVSGSTDDAEHELNRDEET